MSRSLPGLMKRGDTWGIRKRVPDALRAAFGKTEIWRSLRTSDRNTAMDAYWIEMPLIEKQLKDKQYELNASKPRPLSEAQAREFAIRHYSQKLREQEDSFHQGYLDPTQQLGSEDDCNEEVEEDYKEEVDVEAELGLEEAFLHPSRHREHYGSLVYEADEILLNNGFPTTPVNRRSRPRGITKTAVHVDKSSGAYRFLLNLVRRGELELIRRLRSLHLREPLGTCFDPIFSINSSLQNTTEVVAAPTLAELIDAYLSERHLNETRKAKDIHLAFAPLIEIAGSAIRIDLLTREHFSSTRDLLAALPPNPRKKKSNQRRTLREIADALPKAARKMHPNTVNKHMTQIRTVMNWAVDSGKLDRHYANGLNVPVSDEGAARCPFTAEQLNRIFSSDIFVEPNKAKPSMYWVPLFALFHGLRSEEILQLRYEDFKIIEETYVIEIHRRDGNRLKNRFASREIPVHPKLVELGLETLLEAAHSHESHRLFPDVSRASNGSYTNKYSKRFANFLDRVGVKDNKSTFHSFRHNFRDAARNKGINDEWVCAVGGWQHSHGVHARYGAGVTLGNKVKVINAIEYEGVSFDRVGTVDWRT